MRRHGRRVLSAGRVAPALRRQTPHDPALSERRVQSYVHNQGLHGRPMQAGWPGLLRLAAAWGHPRSSGLFSHAGSEGRSSLPHRSPASSRSTYRSRERACTSWPRWPSTASTPNPCGAGSRRAPSRERSAGTSTPSSFWTPRGCLWAGTVRRSSRDLTATSASWSARASRPVLLVRVAHSYAWVSRPAPPRASDMMPSAETARHGSHGAEWRSAAHLRLSEAPAYLCGGTVQYDPGHVS